MVIVITIPAYNEEKTIGGVLKNIHEVMRKTKLKYKILVVDDCSTDSTPVIAKKSGAVVYSHPLNYGLAETFKTEMQKSLSLNPEIIVHMDADGQYRAEEIPKLIQPILQNKADLVLGSRFKGRIERMSIMKRMGNKAFSKVISGITRLRISDSQTGFRAFTKEVAKLKITSGFTYTQEQIIRAVKGKFAIREVPIFFHRRGAKTRSRLMKNPVDYAMRAWINLIKIYRDYNPLRFFGIIGGILFGVGFIVGLWFIYLHFTTGIQGHLGLFFLMALSILVGIQILVFGFLADMKKT